MGVLQLEKRRYESLQGPSDYDSNPLFYVNFLLQLWQKGPVILFHFKHQRARMAIATLPPGPDRACLRVLEMKSVKLNTEH